MTYTTTPLASYDTLNNHVGFYITIGVAFVILAVYRKDDFAWISMSIWVIITAIISWNSGEIRVYKNNPVIGHLVRFEPEVWDEAHHGPKNQVSYTTERKMYVVYQVDGNEVIFDANKGEPYPQTATLYQN